ncbi:hypothetical protein PAXY110619_12495 [Paenibacillus xylanexedens]|uniref:Uncharacterized protein n=1 Tax=Paenibacillus xylanexedens TaxID=528191 RepID=A0ABS4RLQ3_PAEXY|nr:hypothetical protein [Paenibacillus xylanexedens]
MKVYGIENKDGYFYNFVTQGWTVWSVQCQLPSVDLADNLLLLYSDNPDFYNADVSPVDID